MAHPRLAETYPELIDLIRASRAARTVADHIGLQRRLASLGWETKDFHETIRNAKARLRDELKGAIRDGDDGRVRQISQAIPELESDLAANRRRWTALRAVQDGIFWRFLGFDRHRIQVLGQAATPVNWLSDSFPSECAAAEEHWKQGRVALLCDLATCVNTGDLLVFYPDKRQLVMTEVKESPHARDDTKQFRGMRMKIEYLNKGYSDELASDAPVLGPGTRPQLRTHLATLRDGLQRAAEETTALARAGDTFVIRVVDLRANVEDVEGAMERFEREEERLHARLGAAWANAPVVMFHSLDRIERDDLAAVPSTAPFTIFPFDEATCAALLLGWVAYRTELNMRTLEAGLTRKGWTVIPRPNGPSADGFIWVKRGSSVVRVPQQLADQLLVELLTASALERSMASSYDRMMSDPSEKVHTGWGWSGEDRVWR